MEHEQFLNRLLLAILLCFTVFVSYNIGKQSTIDKVMFILEDSEKVYPDSVIVQDLRLDISKLR